MTQIRRREDDSLVAASKAETALQAAEVRFAALVTEQQVLIDDAKSQVADAYGEVIEAFGSRARASEYLGITAHRLQVTLSHRTTGSDATGDATKPSASEAST